MYMIKELERYRRWYMYMIYAYVYGGNGGKGRALWTHIHLISWHYMIWYRPGRGMPGRGMCIFMVKWIGCRRLGNMRCPILYVYVYEQGKILKGKLSTHSTCQGYIYIQVMFLSQDMCCNSLMSLYMIHIFCILLFMPYILGTLFVLTSLLVDAAFHAAQVSRQVDLILRSLTSSVDSAPVVPEPHFCGTILCMYIRARQHPTLSMYKCTMSRGS